ncbi:uncharacterized protein LOC116831143 isoform X2 [Chelonoidis abingdonii]|uniref:uncharacterized protein LOC116831143 isoform X2 n=1 Tax=Chelonoidis abingdonii TaxID=106734 RepID=UPI003F491B5A
MALQVSALALLLALPPLLSAEGAAPSPSPTKTPGVCTRAGNWPPSVSAASPQTEFAVGEWVQVTCRPEQYERSSAWVRCTETTGRVEWDTSRVSCVEKCPRPQWDPRLRFVPDQPFYGWNEQTTLSCPGGFQPSLSVIRCVRWGQTRSHWNAWSEWDWGIRRRITENVTCAGMCNDWVRQVDFDPAQTELGVGAEGRVTCHQQFQQNSFSVTCKEMKSGRFEWDLGAHKCVRKCEIPRTWDSRLQFAPKGQFYTPGDLVTLSCPAGYQPSSPVIVCARNGSQAVWSETPTCQQGEAQTPQPGGLALAVAVPLLVLLAAGVLLLWFMLTRKRQASASRPAKDAGEALYTELQPRDTPDIYCTIQLPEHGASGRNGTASGWHAAPRALQ